MTAQIQIAANAQPGSRQIMLIDADHDLKYFNAVHDYSGCQQQLPARMLSPTACGTAPNAQPALRGFTPVHGTQGTTVALTLAGANFTSPATLQFTPSSGNHACNLPR